MNQVLNSGSFSDFSRKLLNEKPLPEHWIEVVDFNHAGRYFVYKINNYEEINLFFLEPINEKQNQQVISYIDFQNIEIYHTKDNGSLVFSRILFETSKNSYKHEISTLSRNTYVKNMMDVIQKSIHTLVEEEKIKPFLLYLYNVCLDSYRGTSFNGEWQNIIASSVQNIVWKHIQNIPNYQIYTQKYNQQFVEYIEKNVHFYMNMYHEFTLQIENYFATIIKEGDIRILSNIFVMKNYFERFYIHNRSEIFQEAQRKNIQGKESNIKNILQKVFIQTMGNIKRDCFQSYPHDDECKYIDSILYNFDEISDLKEKPFGSLRVRLHRFFN